MKFNFIIVFYSVLTIIYVHSHTSTTHILTRIPHRSTCILNNMSSQSTLEEFQKLLNSQIILGSPSVGGKTEDDYHIRFLAAKNMDASRAFEVYQQYHRMRIENKNLFFNMTPSNLKAVLDSEMVTKLPGTDNEGRAIFLFRFKLWNPKEFSMEQVYLACVLLLEEMSHNKDIQCNGIVMIHDYEGLTLSHCRHVTMRNFMRILQIMQGHFPLKFKAFHEINQPTLFYIMYKIFYPLVSRKLQQRVFLHGSNTELLANSFPLSSLPTTMGGTLDAFSDVAFMRNLFDRNSYYEQLAANLV